MSNGLNEKIYFINDYMEGAHSLIMERLMNTNELQTVGYGHDEYCESAREKIKEACNCPEAEVHFLVGGTQTNATVIDAILRPYQGVIAPTTGHINDYEAGAIEFGGHKIMQVPQQDGKLTVESINEYISAYENHGFKQHMVIPGMVYLTHPTEYGSLYTEKELKDISEVCKKNNMVLYLDGARLGYGLAAEENELTLEMIAKYCDAFYIGGTKCGALFGEAVVITKKDLIPHFFTMIKQHGALLAKGRLLGIQFDTLFTDNLYFEITKNAIKMAKKLRDGFVEKGYKIYCESPTNQLFVVLTNEDLERLSTKVGFTVWTKYDDNHTVIRLVTNWATKEENVDRLLDIL